MHSWLRKSFRHASSEQISRGVFGGLLGLCIAAAAAHAADPPANKYKEMLVDPPTMRGWNKARNCPQSADPKAMLRGDVRRLDPVVFDPFFNSILFPQFTLYKDTTDDGTTTLASNVLPMVEDPKDKKVKWRQSLLPTCRHDFLTMFILQAERNPNQEPFNHLNTLTIQAMRTIALGNYHPLSRYNAALLLSSLHESQSEKPLKGTLPALMACLESTDLVQIAALDGLLKHAKAGSAGAAAATHRRDVENRQSKKLRRPAERPMATIGFAAGRSTCSPLSAMPDRIWRLSTRSTRF